MNVNPGVASVPDPGAYIHLPMAPATAAPVAARGVQDAQNPAAVAFATMRLRQLVRAGLLGAMPQNMSDPTQVWRTLSQGLGSSPQLGTFLAAGQPTPPAALVSEHGAGQATVPPVAIPDLPPGYTPPGAPHLPPGLNDAAHQLPEILAGATPRITLQRLAQAKAVAQTMQHLRKLRPYEGHH